jgi:hypothetical protein
MEAARAADAEKLMSAAMQGIEHLYKATKSPEQLLSEAISNLDIEKQRELCALFLLGRDDGVFQEFGLALEHTRSLSKEEIPVYLLGKRQLSLCLFRALVVMLGMCNGSR